MQPITNQRTITFSVNPTNLKSHSIVSHLADAQNSQYQAINGCLEKVTSNIYMGYHNLLIVCSRIGNEQVYL